jgi:hypothetical protein
LSSIVLILVAKMEIGYERDWFIDGRPVAAAEEKKIL